MRILDGLNLRVDGVSKVSFNVLHTLQVYRSCICILIYIVKSCHQHPYGFQNSMSSWGVGVRFSKLPYSHDFFKIMQKVRWGIKSVLQCSSYFVCIQIRYIPTYTSHKKLPPTFLWVLKFNVKLGFGNAIFEITIFT